MRLAGVHWWDSFEQTSEVVRYVRHALSLSKKDFARELGISVDAVNRWENRRGRPSRMSTALLMTLAKMRGVSMDTV